MQTTPSKIEKTLCDMLNQVFEIEKKLEKVQEQNSISRNLSKLKSLFENQVYGDNETGLVIHNPLGEEYNPTRLDCEANITGESTENLVIIEVIKPIIRLKKGSITQIVQKAVVIVQDSNTIKKVEVGSTTK
ncbi:hypothetical protein [Bernardetia sp.]|uniref:hypothetical protein n=1 Tax=Bernardetia sp. TaxID=1937974 RepID=UPI0025C69781|nr:hypothetical protein [Bernardetia sp.]